MSGNDTPAVRPKAAPENQPQPTVTGIILRWLGIVLLAVLILAALAYLGDYAIFLVRGQPVDQVIVTKYMAAPLKGNNTEFYYEGTGPVPCARALFPQNGMNPCWYVRKHPLYAEPA